MEIHTEREALYSRPRCEGKKWPETWSWESESEAEGDKAQVFVLLLFMVSSWVVRGTLLDPCSTHQEPEDGSTLCRITQAAQKTPPHTHTHTDLPPPHVWSWSCWSVVGHTAQSAARWMFLPLLVWWSFCLFSAWWGWVEVGGRGVTVLLGAGVKVSGCCRAWTAWRPVWDPFPPSWAASPRPCESPMRTCSYCSFIYWKTRRSLFVTT